MNPPEQPFDHSAAGTPPQPGIDLGPTPLPVAGTPLHEQPAVWPTRPGEYDPPPTYGPPGAGAGAPYPGGPYGGEPMGFAAPRRTNRLAIVTLITGLIGLVVFALGFGIAALVQVGRRNEKGRGLAIGGLVAALAWTCAGVVVYKAVVSPFASTKRDAAGHVVNGGKIFAKDLRIGDCLTGPVSDTTRTVKVMPCTVPHSAEVVATATLPDRPSFPGDAWINSTSERLCQARYGELARSRLRKNLQSYFLKPKRDGWDNGIRKVTCMLRLTGGNALTSPLAATVERGTKLYKELAVRDCLTGVPGDDTIYHTTSCNSAHTFQVYSKVDVTRLLPKRKSKAYPGHGALEKQVTRYCEKRGTAVFAARPPKFSIQGGYLYPSDQQWNTGIKVAFCIAKRTSGSLNRSVVPE
ncbi:DUF4190 domain-containing protein [Actinomadura napierensis]|uniref:Septum formation-related domain-containing protein n=1 Tax=Actinomadura napierensis TaxID=267854 RepID=A0ABN3A894_9ACTN